MMTPKFNLGQVVATPGALAALEEAKQGAANFLKMHVCGIWGALTMGDQAANDRAVKDGSRILSAYHLDTHVKIWIITEADRSSTCILLPDEY